MKNKLLKENDKRAQMNRLVLQLEELKSNPLKSIDDVARVVKEQDRIYSELLGLMD